MACVQNPVQVDSEREEGEIVDELDDLSDISSEEEYLLRQRLHILEKYNNVLERKNAKRTISETGKNGKSNDSFLCDLSEISATELEEPCVESKNIKALKHLKSYHKPKRRKDPPTVNNLAKRIHRKKSNKSKKKTAMSESSDESDDEYRNKRRKLAHAVAVNKTNVDKTSLKARLEKMLGASHHESEKNFNPQIETPLALVIEEASLEKIHSPESSIEVEKDENKSNLHNASPVYDTVDLCSESDVISITDTKRESNGSIKIVPPEGHDTVDSPQEAIANAENVIIEETQKNRDSDEDLELLREHALKTKTVKTNSKKNELKKQNSEQRGIAEAREHALKTKTDKTNSKKNELKNQTSEQRGVAEAKDALLLSGDEDSDTAELRLICLKSALLKKAFERKQKLKQRRKRMSQSVNLNDELMREQIEYMNLLSDNNTDIESVDMDIGSDGDEKSKDSISSNPTNNKEIEKGRDEKNIMKLINSKEDEFEEDEDLLRAKLLTSLSKNLPNLVHPNAINNVTDRDLPKKNNETEKQATNVSEEKRFIISVGNSDSEGEHEATKNLTKMHMKLSEQAEFQQKLDLFLKSTRMEVEKSVLPDVVQQPLVPPLPKTKEKFVPKTVKHLPKSEQIEYKNLVKRMAELEKIKNARQSSINLVNKGSTVPKETLKPHNFGTQPQPTNNDLEEQIALSRKTIAEESAKVLKLKEEAMKLSHKYKIVSTELRNIATAITLNKKQQKVAQIKLSKIRTQHQLLINSSTTSKHSMPNGNLPMARGPPKLPAASKRPQKENAPFKEEAKTVQLYTPSTLSELQSVKVSVVNDRMEENPRLSVQIDVTNNKKTVKIPKSPVNNSLENNVECRIRDRTSVDVTEELVDRGGKKDKELTTNWGSKNKLNEDDYKSPLQALGSANWKEDPNAVLCRFEIGGHCKDPDCKYLHPQ